MIVLPSMAMRILMSQIVEATHGLTDSDGSRVNIGTIEEKNMKMAAKHAIETCVGAAVWLQEDEIVVRQRPTKAGIFRFEG